MSESPMDPRSELNHFPFPPQVSQQDAPHGPPNFGPIDSKERDMKRIEQAIAPHDSMNHDSSCDLPCDGNDCTSSAHDGQERRCHRTPLTSLKPLPDAGNDAECVVRISEAGSYYLNRAVLGVAGKHGIVIDACGVTLDLNGYEVLGCQDSRSGIVVRAAAGAVIRNGTVRRWSECGIDAAGGPCTHVEGVRCIDNLADGLRLGASATADCVMSCDNAGAGIAAGPGSTLHDCQSFSNSSHGVACEETCRVIDSIATANAGDGFNLGVGSQARACAARHNLCSGFVAASLCSVIECDAIGNEENGVHAASQCVVSRCRSHGSRKGAGVHLSGQGARVDENTCSENRVGIRADRAGNIVTRNAIAASGETAIDAAPGNQVARLVGQPDGVRSEISWSNFVM